MNVVSMRSRGWVPWVMTTALAVCLSWFLAGPTQAEELTIQMVDTAGQALGGGSVEIVPAQGMPVIAPISEHGTITLDTDSLTPEASYDVWVLDERDVVLYRNKAWVFRPASITPKEDPDYAMPVDIVSLTFEGQDNGGVVLVADRQPNPAYAEAVRARAEDQTLETLFGPPRVVGGVALPLMFGNFGSNEDFGVPSAGLGVSVWTALRFGYPDQSSVGTWIGFREIVVGYAQNRYTTDQRRAPGEESDVAFHRVTVGYGIGRMRDRMHLTADAVVAFGGVYDGSNKLEYLDRSYGLFGLGLRGTFIQAIIAGGGIDLGLSAQLGLMYYPADNLDEDHWYGMAPSLSIGVVIF